MIGPNFIDEIDCGNFFDHIDDLLDFPTDDVDASSAAAFLPPATANCDSFPSMWSTHHDPESFPCSDSVFSTKTASDLSAELSVPYEDIVQLEWLSNFVEDSFSGGSLTINNKDQLSTMNKDSSPQQFRTSSPVSVLESSSSCSGGEKITAPLSPEAVGPSRCGRARSKRPRPATFNPRPAIQLISPTSSVAETPHQFITPKDENFAESRPLVKMAKKKKARVSIPLAPKENNQNTTQAQAVRKCMHCEITKTPQWRAGPMGPKTLCNACGVRYKSGRLFPEYRPAASPTFVPSIHSNSHKKVVEMRNKFGEKVDSAEMELIPNSNVQELQLEFI